MGLLAKGSLWGAVALVGAWAGVRAARARRRSLAGKVAIVTGGSRGLGLLIAEELAKRGCKLAICARDRDELERARGWLASSGADVLAVECDVSRTSDVDRLVSETIGRFGCVDVLVNNAGIVQVAPLKALMLADFERAMSVNFWGAVHASLAVLPHMRARGSGRIVNITSVGGKIAVPHLLPYDCAKFAAVGFSEGLRTELARDGVSVTTVIPGLMRTGSHERAEFKGDGQREHRWFSLLARMPGLTMSPRRAARRIVAAAERRQAETVLGLPAKVARLGKELFPRPVLRLLGLTNRLLPSP